MSHPNAVLYSNGSQECERAQQFLESQDFEFQTYRLNEHFTQRSFENEFAVKPKPRFSLLLSLKIKS